jgi:hypothetical protein
VPIQPSLPVLTSCFGASFLMKPAVSSIHFTKASWCGRAFASLPGRGSLASCQDMMVGSALYWRPFTLFLRPISCLTTLRKASCALGSR